MTDMATVSLMSHISRARGEIEAWLTGIIKAYRSGSPDELRRLIALAEDRLKVIDAEDKAFDEKWKGWQANERAGSDQS